MKQQILEKQLEFPFMEEIEREKSELNGVDIAGVYCITAINFVLTATASLVAYSHLKSLLYNN